MPAVVERSQSLKREDISDILIMASADETPFLSMVKKGPEPDNTLFSWPVDLPAKPKGKGVVDEKDVTTFENFSEDRTQLQGRVQIFERTPMVSRIADRVSNVAGVGKGKEFSRNLAKAGLAIKLDMETRFLSQDDSQADNGTVGYETRGAGKWIQSTAQSDLPVPEKYRTPAGNIYSGDSLANCGEDDVKAMLKSRWQSIGKKGKLVGFCAPDFQAAIDTWSIYADAVANKTVVRQFSNDPTEATITQMVNYIVTSFGEVELYPHRNLLYTVDAAGELVEDTVLTAKGALFLDMDFVEVRFNENPTKHTLENKGGGPRALIEAIGALCITNPRAHCKAAPNA